MDLGLAEISLQYKRSGEGGVDYLLLLDAVNSSTLAAPLRRGIDRLYKGGDSFDGGGTGGQEEGSTGGRSNSCCEYFSISTQSVRKL